MSDEREGDRLARVDDLRARLLGTPVLGLAIPNAAGVVEHSAHSDWELVASYLWFTFTAALIWEGNRLLYFRFRRSDTWFGNPWRRIRILLGCVFFYTVPVITVCLWGWGAVTEDPAATGRAIATAVIITVGTTFFIVHVYETVFLLRGWAKARLAAEQLRRAALEAELEALKREVNPHVLFNNLNALSHLVETGNPSAATFVHALAESYRYLLATRRRQLVTLGEELALLERYHVLTSTRYPRSLVLRMLVPEPERARWQLPPVTLPELLENAVKHNLLSPEQPLHLDVRLDGDCLIVANDLRPRGTVPTSTCVGLANMAERFRLTVGRPATWCVGRNTFVVSLPLELGVRPGSDPGQTRVRAGPDWGQS